MSTVPPAPSGSVPPYDPAREWSPSSKIEWGRATSPEWRAMVLRASIDAIEHPDPTLPPIPNCPDGAAIFDPMASGADRFGFTAGNVPPPSGPLPSVAELCENFLNVFGIRSHVCRRGRLWRKRARRAT